MIRMCFVGYKAHFYGLNYEILVLLEGSVECLVLFTSCPPVQFKVYYEWKSNPAGVWMVQSGFAISVVLTLIEKNKSV